MRILHLSSLYTPHAFGGAERVVQVIAEGIASRGIETGVASLVPRITEASHLNDVAILPLKNRNPLWIEDFAKYPGPVRKFNKIATLFNPMTARDFEKLVHKYKPDIVHSHSMVALTPWMWKVAKVAGAVTVHTLHDFDLLCIRAALYKDGQVCEKQHLSCSIFSKLKRDSHERIDHVVGVSQSILDKHLEFGFFNHLPASSRHVIWNPVKQDVAPRKFNTGSSRNGDGIVFGFIGRLVPEKGILTLIESCRLLGEGNWRLKVAGRAPKDDPALFEMAKGLPIDFLGFVEPSSFFDQIDVLVAPSIWPEPFGLTAVEAYAAGVPVIGADIAGTAEIVNAVDPRWLVPSGNAQALADKMATLIDSRAEGALQCNDPVDVLARTAPDHVVDQYLKLYGLAISSRA